MMNEDIKKERMEKYGCITWCEARETMCFGILTPDGKCKYETCLHDDPNWIAQQKRIEEKRRASMEVRKITIPEKPEEKKPVVKEFDPEAERRKIRNLEAKARALYMAGERKEADRVFNKARKARKKLWDMQNL